MIVGRKKEIHLIKATMEDDKSHFIAVYGRRRVGKTFLIREACGYRFTFQHAGLYDGNMKEQLFAFKSSLKEAGADTKKIPANWAEAFEKLKDLIRESMEKKKIIFIDELSWMDTPKSDLMRALENFWNGWASARKDIVLIICASATTWILSKVIHNKGGLYHRLTEQIHLEQFCLAECEEYVRSSNIAFSRDQILQYYMIFGGVPFYWSLLRRGESVVQNTDRILFAKDAPLKDEFNYLYASVFRNPHVYLQIIRALAKKKQGMTREDIITDTGIPNSGALTAKLEELENCGFIRKYTAFGQKKKNAIYQITDQFTLFYYQFLEDNPTDELFWSNQINTPRVNAWMGLAFEKVCMAHIQQIKYRLGISGVLTDVNAWSCKSNPDRGLFGSQIDMLIVRKDQVINLCEVKYSQAEYTLTSKETENIRRRIHDFQTATGTHFAIYPTLITTHGMVANAYSGEIQSVIVMDDLFVSIMNKLI